MLLSRSTLERYNLLARSSIVLGLGSIVTISANSVRRSKALRGDPINAIYVIRCKCNSTGQKLSQNLSFYSNIISLFKLRRGKVFDMSTG